MTTPYNVFIGKKLSSLMSSRGITQNELASKLGTRQDKISRLCRGYAKIGQEEITKIVKLYNLPSDYFAVKNKQEAFGDELEIDWHLFFCDVFCKTVAHRRSEIALLRSKLAEKEKEIEIILEFVKKLKK